MKKGISVLIIEDEQTLLETLKLKLIKEGFKVDTCTDGKAGLDKIKKNKPALILLDLMLPSMSGQEILKALQKDKNFSSPVIVISNSGQPVEIKEVLDLGADDYIIKANFTIDDVLERVYNTLEKQSGQPDILIAEDEAFLRMVMSKKLRLEGFKVVTTMDGDSTFKTIMEIKPKAVILDLLMPGMSGIEVLEALKKEKSFDKKKTKIIVLSNYSGKEEESIIKEMTFGYYIKSNFDIDQVAEEVRKLLK